VLTVFHKMDVRCDGRVQVDEFIEGLLRVKQQVQGIDVAVAKSWMRRVVGMSKILGSEARDLQAGFVYAVERLRGIHTVSREAEDEDQDSPCPPQVSQQAALSFAQRQARLTVQNQVLANQISTFAAHIRTRKRMLQKDAKVLLDAHAAHWRARESESLDAEDALVIFDDDGRSTSFASDLSDSGSGDISSARTWAD